MNNNLYSEFFGRHMFSTTDCAYSTVLISWATVPDLAKFDKDFRVRCSYCNISQKMEAYCIGCGAPL